MLRAWNPSLVSIRVKIMLSRGKSSSGISPSSGSFHCTLLSQRTWKELLIAINWLPLLRVNGDVFHCQLSVNVLWCISGVRSATLLTLQYKIPVENSRYFFSNVQNLKNISMNFLNFSNTKYILVETKPLVFNPFSSQKHWFCYRENTLL